MADGRNGNAGYMRRAVRIYKGAIVKDSSVKALLVMSVILLVLGIVIMSPDGRLFSLALAGICAAVAALGGKSKGKRIAAVLVFAAALGLAVSTYPEHRASFDHYRKSVRP